MSRLAFALSAAFLVGLAWVPAQVVIGGSNAIDCMRLRDQLRAAQERAKSAEKLAAEFRRGQEEQAAARVKLIYELDLCRNEARPKNRTSHVPAAHTRPISQREGDRRVAVRRVFHQACRGCVGHSHRYSQETRQ